MVFPTTKRVLYYASAAQDVWLDNRNDPGVDDMSDDAHEFMAHSDLEKDVKTSREAFYKDIKARFFEKPREDVMEFWLIATYMDPRFKEFDFNGNDLVTEREKKDATCATHLCMETMTVQQRN